MLLQRHGLKADVKCTDTSNPLLTDVEIVEILRPFFHSKRLIMVEKTCLCMCTSLTLHNIRESFAKKMGTVLPEDLAASTQNPTFFLSNFIICEKY